MVEEKLPRWYNYLSDSNNKDNIKKNGRVMLWMSIPFLLISILLFLNLDAARADGAYIEVSLAMVAFFMCSAGLFGWSVIYLNKRMNNYALKHILVISILFRAWGTAVFVVSMLLAIYATFN